LPFLDLALMALFALSASRMACCRASSAFCTTVSAASLSDRSRDNSSRNSSVGFDGDRGGMKTPAEKPRSAVLEMWLRKSEQAG
jgi:hypothetical protein